MARQVNNLLDPLGFLKQRLLRCKSNGLLKIKHEAVELLATAMALVAAAAAAMLGYAEKSRECEWDWEREWEWEPQNKWSASEWVLVIKLFLAFSF